MSGQNFNEINQILKKLKNNDRGSNSCEHYKSNEPKSSCPRKSSCPPKPYCEPKKSHHANHLTKDCEGNVKITGDLTVCEDVCVGNELQVNTISSKDSNKPLCVDSELQVDTITTKDSNKPLCIDSELQVDVISVKNTNIPLEIKSNTQINESLYVQECLYTNNIYAVESNCDNEGDEGDEVVNINNNTNINGDLCVQENIIVDSIIPKPESNCVNISDLSVENIKFTSNDSTCDTGNITGNVSLRNDLYVNGTITSCSGIKTNNLTVGGQLTLCDTLKVPHFEVCGNTTLGSNMNYGCDEPNTKVNGNLCVSNKLEVWDECDSTGNKVEISGGCVSTHAFVGQVGELKLNSGKSSDDVSNYTSLIVTGTDSTTDDGELTLNTSKEGQILVVINKSVVDLTIDSVTITPGLSRVIVYYSGSWH